MGQEAQDAPYVEDFAAVPAPDRTLSFANFGWQSDHLRFLAAARELRPRLLRAPR